MAVVVNSGDGKAISMSGIILNTAFVSGLAVVVTSGDGKAISLSGTRVILQSGTAFIRSDSGVWKTGTINVGSTLSLEIDLDRDFTHVNLEMPVMTSTSISIYTAQASGGTFQVLSAADTWNIATGNKNTTLTLGMWEYMKVNSSVAQGSTVTFYARGVNM
jgi:hypothetical protein